MTDNTPADVTVKINRAWPALILAAAAAAFYLLDLDLIGLTRSLAGLRPYRDAAANAYTPILCLVSTGWLIVVVLGWLGLGWPLVSRLDSLNKSGRLIFSTILGAGVSSLILFFMAAARQWSFWPILVVTIGALLSGVSALVVERGRGQRREPWTAAQYALAAAIVLIVLPAFVRALLPPTMRDELIYQLAHQKLYLQLGGLEPLPYMRSYYPMAVSLLFGQALALDGDRLARLVHFALFCTTLSLLGWAAAKARDRSAALWSMLSYASLPVILHLAGVAYVDHGLALFAMAALVMAWLHLRSDSLPDLLLAGAFAGFSLWTKYNALHVLIALGFAVMVVKLKRRDPLFKAAALVIIMLAVAGAVNLPGMARNMLLKGNPLYPLLPGIFGGEIFQPGIEHIPEHRWEMFTSDAGDWGWWWYRWLSPILIPLSASTAVRAEVDGPMSPLPLIAALLAAGLALTRRSEDKQSPVPLIAIYTAALVVLFVLTSRLRVRYLINALPPLCLLMGLTMSGIREVWTKPQRWTAGAVVVAVACSGALWGYAELARLSPLDFLTGKEGRQGYLMLRVERYPVMDWINRNLPPDAKIYYFYFGAEIYYCERDVLHDEIFYDYTLRRLVSQTADTHELVQEIEKLGVTHVVSDYSFLFRALNDRRMMDQEEAERIAYLFRRMPVVQNIGTVYIQQVSGP